MDRLETYLDQVCRGIAGPRSLRQHVRRELREHLMDAAAEHRSAGLSDDESMMRALVDFGAPEQVRTELEATHGHRLMAVVVDKAMQWKEKTMRAKWLWTTWAYVVVLGIIAVNSLFLSFAQVMCIPKLKKIESDRLLDVEELNRMPLMRWLTSWLSGLNWLSDHLTWILLMAIGAWGLFEWRARSENKSFMRLSALGSVALVLSVMTLFVSSALILPFLISLPSFARTSPNYAREQLAIVNTSITAIENALVDKDWDAMRTSLRQTNSALNQVQACVRVVPLMSTATESLKVEDIRTQLHSASDQLREIESAISDKDVSRIQAALQRFRTALSPIWQATRH